MIPMNTIYNEMGIRETVLSFGKNIEKNLKDRFEKIDEIAEYNQLKVIKAMQDNRVSAGCFNYASGYGYDDQGRDTLEKVYASIFHTESALVRPQITCGTHALSLALAANLRPGDELLAPAGKPYDTLEEVIGIRPSNGSLAEYGISYSQVDLLADGTFDYENIKKAINDKTKMVAIQRSKGYQTRPSFSVKQIGELITFVKGIKPDLVCMVDNCYGCCYHLTDHCGYGCTHHAPLKAENENRVKNDVDKSACQCGNHSKFRVPVCTDNGIHSLTKHIKRNPKSNIEEIFL